MFIKLYKLYKLYILKKIAWFVMVNNKNKTISNV
jgi:hypothetical protein